MQDSNTTVVIGSVNICIALVRPKSEPSCGLLATYCDYRLHRPTWLSACATSFCSKRPIRMEPEVSKRLWNSAGCTSRASAVV